METLITQGQKKQIGRFIADSVEGFLETLLIGKDAAQKVIERGGELQAAIKAAVESKIFEFSSSQIAEWTKFYSDYLGLTVDLSSVKIPERRNGFARVIIIAKELLIASNGKPHAFVIKAMKKNFSVWAHSYADDLDKAIVKNDRWPEKASYAVNFRDRVEADEELRNISADELTKCGIPGTTFLERLLYELKFFAETGEHLDLKNWTLCSGSRYFDGGVPHVNFCDGEVDVDGCRSSYSRGDLRTRSVAV